jgi:hypothetical protein
MSSVNDQLEHCTGTSQYWKHPLSTKFVYTDGVRELAKLGEAFWLIDVITSHQINPILKSVYLQVWKLEKDSEGGCKVSCYDDTEYVLHQDIPYTDFPYDYGEIWVIDNVLLLPNEY